MYGGTLDLNGYHLTIGYIRTEGGYGGTITNNATGSGTSTLTLASGLSELFDSTICDGPYGKLAVIIGSTTVPGTAVVIVNGTAGTYTGGTTINSGSVLCLGWGGSASISGNIVNHAILEFLESGPLTFDNTITDNGNGDGEVVDANGNQITLANLATDLVLSGDIVY